MFSFLTFLFRLIFNLFESKTRLLVQVSLHEMELEILKRHHGKKRVRFCIQTALSYLSSIESVILKTIYQFVKPETVLGWQRQLIKHFWTFKNTKRVGRPPVSKDVKRLILAMKNDNLLGL